MFHVQLFSAFGGWADLADGSFNNKKEAIQHAQLYRIEAAHPKPTRVIELVVHREWSSDDPIEI